MANSIIDLTVILNSYNRPSNIQKQIDILERQTFKPKEIWVWCNKGTEGLPVIKSKDIKIIQSNHNFKFHGRFSLGLLAQTKYVCVLDDDCFPQPEWFENCIKTIEKVNGILGCSGIFLKGDKYMPHEKIGWNGTNNDTAREVDLVGHCWFFKKEHLKYLWMEEPVTWDNGEDIQFSYLAQKYGNIKTYVPPHPVSNKKIWGNDYALGVQHGNDKNATYLQTKNHFQLRDMLCETYIKKGWKLVKNK